MTSGITTPAVYSVDYCIPTDGVRGVSKKGSGRAASSIIFAQKDTIHTVHFAFNKRIKK